jgi:hypothetical protein
MSLTNVEIDLTAEHTLETLRSEVARIVPARYYFVEFRGEAAHAESCVVHGVYTDEQLQKFACADENYLYEFAENVARLLTDLVEVAS